MLSIPWLFSLELRAALRERMPGTVWRRFTIGGFLLLVGGAAVGALFFPLPADAPPPSPAALIGPVVANFVISLGMALSASVVVLQEPADVSLHRLAPVSPLRALLLRIAPVTALAAAPLFVFFWPVVVLMLRRAPVLAGALVLAGGLVLAWAVLLALGLLAELARWRGMRQAAYVGKGVSAALTMGWLAGSTWLFGLSLPLSAAAVVLVASVALLAPAARRVSRLLGETLATPDPVLVSPAPRWGRPGWWRMVARTPAPWALGGLLPALLVLSWIDFPLRGGVLALLLVMIALTPLHHLVEPEHAAPDRLRLAPGGAAALRSLMVTVGVPVQAGVSVLALALGWGAWSWVLLVVLLSAVVQLTVLIPRSSLRRIAQWLFMGCAVLGAVFV